MIVHHQAAIAGKVKNLQTGQIIQGALVSIIDAPSKFQEWLLRKQEEYGRKWDTMQERPDRTLTAFDGIFRFIDLMEGSYTLEVSMPGYVTRYGTTQFDAEITMDANGKINMVSSDIALSPTTVKGRITQLIDSQQEPVMMAEVRVIGSNEHAYSDEDGQYRIIALEASDKRKRRLRVTCRDCRPVEQSIWVYKAGDEERLDFVLVPTI